MRFSVPPLQEFLVRPALPASMPRLAELAYNVLWSWDHVIRAVFRRLDPHLWVASGHNPILMLSQVPQSTLERAATDPRYVAQYRRACESLDAYLERYNAAPKQGLIAYFCMEFGIVAVPADLLRRPRHSRRRPSEGGQRHRLAAGGRRPALSGGLFPPVAEPGWLAAGALSGQRFLHAARDARARCRRQRAEGLRGPAGGRASPSSSGR